MENLLKDVRKESNTWRIIRGKMCEAGVDDSPVDIAAESGGEGRDGSGSTSLNRAGSRFDRTGRLAPEHPRPGSLE